MSRALVAALLLWASCACAAPHEYRYIEGERYSATEGSGLRLEGFTSWMAHPSHGEVMVLGGPGSWLEYEVKDLGSGPYHLFVRGLAWASGCEVEVYWDGELVGRTSYPKPGTALKWSNEVGTISGPGDHRLRLVGAPGIIQAPYLDVILLTTQEGLQPSDADRDFESFTTPLPLLQLKTATGELSVMPEPGGETAEGAPCEIAGLSAGPLGIGANEVTVGLRASDGAPRRLTVQVGEQRAEASVPPEESEVTVLWQVERPGAQPLTASVSADGRELLSGCYTVTVPDPVRVALDEYAYELGAPVATWTATYTARPEVAAACVADVELRASGADVVLARHTAPGAGGAVTQALPLAGLPGGRYVVTTQFTRDGRPMVEDRREFILFDPVPLEVWEPIQRTEARGDVILVNGNPFLGKLLFHAPADEKTRHQGFNLVQCYGGDPNPLDSIQRHLDACEEHGVWGTVALFNNQYFRPGREFDLEHLREAVLRFREHPAVFGWDLVDEPDGAEMLPEAVAEAARLLRELDPNHIVWVNLCRVDQGLDWLESQDLWSYDAYPFPVQGFAGYAPWLKLSDEHLRGKRPLGTCLQTWQWTDESALPMPTPDQLRASAWLHILHGYKWFGYYSYYDPEPSGCLARNPLLWSYCRALNAQLRAMEGLILAPEPFELLDAGPDMTAGVKAHEGQRYLIVVSGAREPAHVRVPVEGQAARVLFEREGEVEIEGGVLEDDLGAYGTRVYEVQ